MDTQDVVILDVWKRDEYDAGHIPGEGFHGSGLLPQRKPQQNRVLQIGRAGLRQYLQIWRRQHLAL